MLELFSGCGRHLSIVAGVLRATLVHKDGCFPFVCVLRADIQDNGNVDLKCDFLTGSTESIKILKNKYPNKTLTDFLLLVYVF